MNWKWALSLLVGLAAAAHSDDAAKRPPQPRTARLAKGIMPPVAPDAAVSSSQLTGSASPWLLALLSASAAMLGTLVVVQGLSWKNSRRVAWRHDVAYLLRAPRLPAIAQA